MVELNALKNIFTTRYIYPIWVLCHTVLDLMIG